MLSTSPYECPQHLLDQAGRVPRVATAVVGATDRLSLESARQAALAGLIEPVLIGPQATIRELADNIGWCVGALRIVDAKDEVTAATLAAALARDGEVSALMKGHVHTDVLMRAVIDPAAQLRTSRRVSHAFYMTVPGRDGSLVITDAAVNIAPNVDQMMDILGNVVELMHALGRTKPAVAVLSATEQPSNSMPSSLLAEEVRRRAIKEIPDALVDGPMALDNAISVEAARIKGIESPVAGCAEVLLVPNIETGNALFKAMVYLLSATAAGIVLGARVPIILTSRADPPEARLASAALAAIVSTVTVSNGPTQS